MDVISLANELIECVAELPYVKDIDLKTEVFILKARITFKENYFLQIYYNSQTKTRCFALIKNEVRVWGVDFDNMRGWYEHPLENPEEHKKIDPLSVKEICEIIKEVLEKVFV